MLRTFAIENPQNWDDYLPFILMAYRATQNKSTGCTPNLVFLNREIVCPLDLMVGKPPNTNEEICPIQYIEWVESAMSITNEFVFQNLGIAAKRQKSSYDQRLKPREYKRGNWVWRWYPPTANQKLSFGWTGPYLVLKRLSETTYSIIKAVDKPVVNVHVDHLKPYQGQNTPDSWLEENETVVAGNDQTDTGMSIDEENQAEHNLNSEIDRTSLTELPEYQETNIAADTLGNQTKTKIQKKQDQIPVIQSRRDRLVKPKQIWSPSKNNK